MTAHVTTNSWDAHTTPPTRHIPCICRFPSNTDTSKIARPKDLNGVMRIVGQRISTGKWLYACYSCFREREV